MRREGRREKAPTVSNFCDLKDAALASALTIAFLPDLMPSLCLSIPLILLLPLSNIP